MADQKISQLTAATLPLAGTEVLPIVQGGVTVKVSSDNLTTKNFRSNATSGILQVAGPGAGTTRVMTTPNANFTAARTDASQTFTGLQIFSNGGNENIRLSDGTANSTLQQNSANLYFNVNDSAATNGAFFWRSSNSLTTVMTLNGATGDLTANTGNFVLGTAGKGIDFSANGGDVLSQYDEGTWNVTWANLTGTPTSTQGRYTRIGRMVFFSYYTGPGAISGTANSVSFSLPFTPAYGFSGSMIAGNITNAGSILIWTGGLAYPETFSASEMVFSGMFFV